MHPAMTAKTDGGHPALVQLQAYLSQHQPAENSRLPTERELIGILGVSRGPLRKALAILEDQGQIWRHVGKGTFVGSGPFRETVPIAEIAARTKPAEVMRARLLLEPQFAREAALHASRDDIGVMRQSLALSRRALTWHQDETCDNLLHRQIVAASGNRVLVGLFDSLSAIRRAVVWGRLREERVGVPETHHGFAEHDRIVEAISQRSRRGSRSHADPSAVRRAPSGAFAGSRYIDRGPRHQTDRQRPTGHRHFTGSAASSRERRLSGTR